MTEEKEGADRPEWADRPGDPRGPRTWDGRTMAGAAEAVAGETTATDVTEDAGAAGVPTTEDAAAAAAEGTTGAADAAAVSTGAADAAAATSGD